MTTAAMIARPIPPHFNVGTSQVGMVPSFSRSAIEGFTLLRRGPVNKDQAPPGWPVEPAICGRPQAMPRRAYLLITAVIFALVALLHLARIGFGWSAVLAGRSVPMWLSWVALVVTGALAYFEFSLATQSSRKGSFS
jgi:hypothetical protein